MICLASTSPRRIELLRKLTDDFFTEAPEVNENTAEKKPKRMVKELALRKAQSKNYENILAADTIVTRGGKIYGKPKSRCDAVKILMELSGKTHKVYTGVAIKCGAKTVVFAVCSKVKMKKLTKSEIENYVDTEKPFDKAGAYAVQDGRIVESYKGSYSNIMGLPLEKLERVLYKLGLI